MITEDENRLLTRIGPGSRMGQLLRRYWHVAAAVSEFDHQNSKRVRLLGEDLVLFKDADGKFGLVGEFCPHRGASLAWGIPTRGGLRCMYHGWEFNHDGVCVHQPFETHHALSGKKAITGFRVQALGGLLFAYMGPEPAPELPRLEALAGEGAFRHVSRQIVPCNWLQIMENSADPVHTEWLHGKFAEYITGGSAPHSRKHARIGFDEFEYGMIKRRLMEGQSEDVEDWKVGHPLVFPTTLFIGLSSAYFQTMHLQFRVPIDDEHTAHYWYAAFFPHEGIEVPTTMRTHTPLYSFPVKDENGQYLLQYIDNQDILAWTTQGVVANRSGENLGRSDQGIALLRRMFKRELEKVERGEDTIGTIRDPERNRLIKLPVERHKDMQSEGAAKAFSRTTGTFSPYAPFIQSILETGKPPADWSADAALDAFKSRAPVP